MNPTPSGLVTTIRVLLLSLLALVVALLLSGGVLYFLYRPNAMSAWDRGKELDPLTASDIAQVTHRIAARSRSSS